MYVRIVLSEMLLPKTLLTVFESLLGEVKEPTEEASILTNLSNVSSLLKWFLSTMSFR